MLLILGSIQLWGMTCKSASSMFQQLWKRFLFINRKLFHSKERIGEMCQKDKNKDLKYSGVVCMQERAFNKSSKKLILAFEDPAVSSSLLAPLWISPPLSARCWWDRRRAPRSRCRANKQTKQAVCVQPSSITLLYPHPSSLHQSRAQCHLCGPDCSQGKLASYKCIPAL